MTWRGAAFVLLLCPTVAALATTPPIRPMTGALSIAWPLGSDEEFDAAYKALGTRHGFKIPEDYPATIREKSQSKNADGTIADPTYELYVPKDYHHGRMLGLIVWINAGDSGAVPRAEWKSVLDKHHLIWVGPNDVGNNRDTLWRHYMATEAVRQARLRYTVDDERVYVAGFSGGGRIASHVAVVNADTFTGGVFVAGCDFWRDIPVDPKQPRGKHYRGFWQKQDGKILRIAKTTSRFVLLTGETDFNRANTYAVHDAYKKDQYKHATLLDVPGMAHTVPDAGWFDKAIAALDEPLAPPAKLFEQAQKLTEKKKPGEACLAYGRAAVRGAGQPYAAEAVRKSMAIRKQYDATVAEIRAFIDKGKLDAAAKLNDAMKSLYTTLAERQATEF